MQSPFEWMCHPIMVFSISKRHKLCMEPECPKFSGSCCGLLNFKINTS